MANKIIGGPARELKWGGIVLTPAKDGEPEYEINGTDYTTEASPNGDFYSTGEIKTGYFQQECVMNAEEYDAFSKLKDGVSRAGTATLINNSVLNLDCIIDGEHNLANGRLTVRLAGKVSLQ